MIYTQTNDTFIAADRLKLPHMEMEYGPDGKGRKVMFFCCE